MKNTTLDILLIEDNLAEAGLIKDQLSEVKGQQYSVEHIQYLAQGLDLLRDRNFDVIILDLGLPDSQGLDTLTELRNHEKHTPAIVMTVLDDEEMALKSLDMDIQDYLIKSEITSSILKRSIRYAMQRKRSAEELRRSELKFATIFQVAPVLLDISKPVDGEIIEVNETMLTTCGYQREEMVGRTAQQLCIWENPTDRDKVVRALLEQGPVRDLVINFKDKSGQLVNGLLSAELLEIEGERYMLSLVKDITEQKRIEAEIKRLNASLASRADELEYSNEELAAFNRTVSHDLRQPLNVISTACQAVEMLSGDKLDMESKGFLTMALDAVKRMSELIAALLKFSHSAHSELSRRLVDLGDMAKVIAANLRLTDPGRHVTFRIAESLKGNADLDLIMVVLENLIGNAWKYTGENRAAVIEFGSAKAEGGAAFFVRDNGPGFSMADAKNLFMPFTRLTGTAKFSGHGIGLATVDKIIRRHGGKVWAEGEPGKGATFYFTLSADEV